MSLELKEVEKKVGIETHIYSTNLKLEKNTINVLFIIQLSNYLHMHMYIFDQKKYVHYQRVSQLMR